ncbi:MAG TPA: FtsX-like permease family protein [Allosphingosinicella sp.]|nr:FtsX-like permease family protein [Allosphingosinicella sp.]
MWGNYLTVAWRALSRHKVYAAINLVGLAIGLAACLLIFLYVRYETRYDRWLPGSDRIYQVQTLYTDPETGERRLQQGTEGVVADTLAKDFPQIEAIVRAESDRQVLFDRQGEAANAETISADPNFFRILPVPFLRGDPASALSAAGSLVLSRSEAIKRFGSLDVVGQAVTGIRRGEKYALQVTGVFEDLPRNSHMDFTLVKRITEEEKAECGWGCINGFVYLKLRPGFSADAINLGLPAWEKRNIPRANVDGKMVSEGDAFDWKLVNLSDVHLSGAEGSDDRPGNDRRTLATFSIVALLILAMACVNFVNLSTARAGQRAREVALRKVLGARRGQLVAQFLGESLLLAGLALLIAIALAEVSLPWLASFLKSDLRIAYLGPDGILIPALALLLTVGLVGGVYPAFYLSRYQPGAVLRANQSAAEPAGSGRIRSALVIAQFSVSIGLIVCTAIVYSQTRFAQSVDPGYRRDGLIQATGFNRAIIANQTDSVLLEMAKVPGVRSVAAANIRVASGQTLTAEVSVPGRPSPVTMGWYGAHPDFVDTMGIRLLAGRNLSRQFANDNGEASGETREEVDAQLKALTARGLNVMVNQLGARRLGFRTPAEAIGKQLKASAFGTGYGLLPMTIVGVTADSRFRSARQTLEPMIFYDSGTYSNLLVRYVSNDPAAALAGVERVWKRMAPEVPFDGNFADAHLAELYAADEARGTTFAGFALLAIVVACLGLFGLAAFTAERRTREIGIRKVFGARISDIVRLLAWQFSKPVVLANLIAWPVAWWAMRDWLNGFDARIDLGPGPFLMAGILALAIALGTIAGHAVKVARLNPIHALRYE